MDMITGGKGVGFDIHCRELTLRDQLESFGGSSFNDLANLGSIG